MPRSEPDSGNPTVRDRRGACGNVDNGETVVSQPRSSAPYFYPDQARFCEGRDDN